MFWFQRRTTRSFMLGVHAPSTGRFKNLRNPPKGTMVSVRGVCLGVNTSEVAEIELEDLTFIHFSGGSQSSASSSQASSSSPVSARSAGRSKRELLLERQESPVKKVKIGPASAFLGPAALDEFTGEAAPESGPSSGTLSD